MNCFIIRINKSFEKYPKLSNFLKVFGQLWVLCFSDRHVIISNVFRKQRRKKGGDYDKGLYFIMITIQIKIIDLEL